MTKLIRVPTKEYGQTDGRAENNSTPNECEIDPFPIIGFYLYHVISAGQSNNWTTSGM